MERKFCAPLILAALVTHSTQAEQPFAARIIYRCKTELGLMFSDRPCGPGSEPYQPGLAGVSIVETVVPEMPARISAVKPVQRGTSAVAATSRAHMCDRLDLSLRRIASTLRSGYGAKQGERLKQRKRELEEQRRSQHCH